MAGHRLACCENNNMHRLAALTNKHQSIAKIVCAQFDSSSSDFFKLYQSRLSQRPEQHTAILQQMLSQPFFIQYVEQVAQKTIKQLYPGMNTKTGDLVNEVVSSALQTLPTSLENYNPNTSPLQSYINRGVSFVVRREFYKIQKDNRAPNKQQMMSLDEPDLATYDPVEGILESRGDSVQGVDYFDTVQRLEQELERLQSRLSHLEMYDDERSKNGANALRNQIERIKAQLNPSGHYNDDLPVKDLRDIYKQERRQIPDEELSEHLYNMMRLPSTHSIKKDGSLPVHSFYSKHIGADDPGLHKLVSRLMFESTMELRREFEQSRHKNQDIKEQKQFSVADVPQALAQKLVQKMTTIGLDPDIQQRVLASALKSDNISNYNNPSRGREVYYRLMEADELMRFSLYSWYKDSMFPGIDWSQIPEASLRDIAESVYSYMDYGNNNSMAVRSYNAARGPKALDPSPRVTNNIPKEVAMQVMMTELKNLKSQQKGPALFGHLPHGSEWFNKPKTEYEQVEEQPFGNITNVYNNVLQDTTQNVHAAVKALVVYASWCDSLQMYEDADRAARAIRTARAIIS